MEAIKAKCKFCRRLSLQTRKTLYGVVICESCHQVIKENFRKEDLINLDNRIREHEEHLRKTVPTTVQRQKYKYIREPFRALRSYNVEHQPREEKPVSETERELQSKPSWISLAALFAPVSYRKLLTPSVRAQIENELVGSQAFIDKKQHEYEERNALLLKEQQEAFVIREMEKVIPKKYQSIIRQAKDENILLYEYYLGEYPPDWDYRAGKIKERDNYKCRDCGSEKKLSVHHERAIGAEDFDILSVTRRSFRKKLLRARASRGDHFLDNLVTLCANCHLNQHPTIKQKVKDHYDYKNAVSSLITRYGLSEARNIILDKRRNGQKRDFQARRGVIKTWPNTD